LAQKKQADAVVGVSETDNHPYWAMKLLPTGVMEAFMTIPQPLPRRQDLPPAYGLNGAVYVNRCTSLRRDRTFTPRGALAYVMPPERSLDVDTDSDFLLVEQILKQHHALT